MSNASIADVEAMLPSKQRHYPYPPGSFVSRTRPPCKMPFPICALHTYYIIYAKRPSLRRKPFFSSCSPMYSCPIYEVFKCELTSFILTKYSNLEGITKNFCVSNRVIDCALSSIHRALKFSKKKLRKRFGLYWMKAVLLHSLSGSKAVSRFP